MTSSSSNWFVCEMPADCADVPDAVDCLDGYCVDAAGRRIVAASGGSGGSASGGSASGGAASDGSGATSSGGTAGSGGEAANLAGADGSGGAPTATCDDYASLEGCAVADDCVAAEIVVDCCGTVLVTGVAVEHEATFNELAAECALQSPGCACPQTPNPKTEDGRWLLAGEATLSCVDGRCRTAVVERPCGEATCGAGQVCVLHTTVLGPNETQELSCVDNPCPDEELDCSCALDVCELGDGRSRLCSLPLAEADIACQDQAQ